MANPFYQFGQKVFKLPECWRSLLFIGGLILADKFVIDRQVQHYIFGDDGKGGEVLLCQTRVHDPHEREHKEARRKWYWHQRKGQFYMPQDIKFNDQLSYQELSYNYSHRNTYLDPKDLPKHHAPDAFYFNELEPEDFYK